MELIRTFVEPKVEVSTLLSKDQALAVFDLFVNGNNAIGIKHKIGIPVDKSKLLYNRLCEIREMIERIVLRKAKLVKEEGHFEEETWVIDVEEVLCPVPTTIEKLKERSLELIDISEPLFIVNNVEELVTGINTVIDKFIQYSSPGHDADFNWWKQKVIENDSI
jgi:hypothetical protein